MSYPNNAINNYFFNLNFQSMMKISLNATVISSVKSIKLVQDAVI